MKDEPAEAKTIDGWKAIKHIQSKWRLHNRYTLTKIYKQNRTGMGSKECIYIPDGLSE